MALFLPVWQAIVYNFFHVRLLGVHSASLGMGSLMSVKSTMRKTAAASESLFALLESKKAAVAETESKGALSGDIVFENVNFHYASRSDVSLFRRMKCCSTISANVVLWEHSLASNLRIVLLSLAQVAVLSNFNLTIEQGKTTVLVGPSGSGKSTAAALLTRLYEPRVRGAFVCVSAWETARAWLDLAVLFVTHCMTWCT